MTVVLIARLDALVASRKTTMLHISFNQIALPRTVDVDFDGFQQALFGNLDPTQCAAMRQTIDLAKQMPYEQFARTPLGTLLLLVLPHWGNGSTFVSLVQATTLTVSLRDLGCSPLYALLVKILEHNNITLIDADSTRCSDFGAPQAA